MCTTTSHPVSSLTMVFLGEGGEQEDLVVDHNAADNGDIPLMVDLDVVADDHDDEDDDDDGAMLDLVSDDDDDASFLQLDAAANAGPGAETNGNGLVDWKATEEEEEQDDDFLNMEISGMPQPAELPKTSIASSKKRPVRTVTAESGNAPVLRPQDYELKRKLAQDLSPEELLDRQAWKRQQMKLLGESGTSIKEEETLTEGFSLKSAMTAALIQTPVTTKKRRLQADDQVVVTDTPISFGRSCSPIQIKREMPLPMPPVLLPNPPMQGRVPHQNFVAPSQQRSMSIAMQPMHMASMPHMPGMNMQPPHANNFMAMQNKAHAFFAAGGLSTLTPQLAQSRQMVRNLLQQGASSRHGSSMPMNNGAVMPPYMMQQPQAQRQMHGASFPAVH